jgi:hypothetical protein
MISNVLPSKHTELVGCFYCYEQRVVFTVDKHSLVRQWNLVDGVCVKTYLLEVTTSKGVQGETKSAFQPASEIRLCTLDDEFKFLLVVFETQVIQVHNLYSGEVLFNQFKEDSFYLRSEAACLGFLSGNGMASNWFLAGC